MTLSAQYALELVTAPATSPVTLVEAKAQMRVEHTDDDTIIQRLIDAATAFVDVQGALGKAMITQTWGQWLTANPGTVSLMAGPAGFSWPTTQVRTDAIKIEYVVGFGDAITDIPQTVRHALMMLVAHWYENREEAQSDTLVDVPYGFEELIGIERGSWYG